MNTSPITTEQYEQFEGYPGLRDELINGRIVMNPQPKPLHQHVMLNILGILQRFCEGTEYIVNGNSNIKFSTLHSMPSPDVFVVLKQEWEEAMESDNYLQNPPLLAVEVLSKANRPKHVHEKIAIYLEAGVKEVWVVNTKERSLAKFPVHPNPLPEFLRKEVDLSSVFQGVKGMES
jgi:Uma2 family endonuclease